MSSYVSSCREKNLWRGVQGPLYVSVLAYDHRYTTISPPLMLFCPRAFNIVDDLSTTSTQSVLFATQMSGK